MNISSDSYVDWNAVPDLGGKIPSGVVQWRILDFTELMTDATGIVEKGDRAGQQKIAKKMYRMDVEGMAPEEAVGLKWKEFFVIGSDTDPLVQQTQTLYESIGVRQLKAVFNAAQVPFSNSLVSTMASAIGATYCQKVDHKRDRRKDTGEEIVAVNTGRTFKIGEVVPQYIPCLIEADPTKNFQGCLMCQAARQAGKGAPVIPVGMPIAGPPVTPPIPLAPKPVAPTAPMAPVPPPVMPQMPQGMPVNPPVPPASPSLGNATNLPPAPGIAPGNAPIPPALPSVPAAVNPVPAPGVTPPVGMHTPQMPVPSNVGQAPPAPPVQTPVAPVAPPQASGPQFATAPAGFMICPQCQQNVSFQDFTAHMAAHQQGQVPPAPQFKPEV